MWPVIEVQMKEFIENLKACSCVPGDLNVKEERRKREGEGVNALLYFTLLLTGATGLKQARTS